MPTTTSLIVLRHDTGYGDDLLHHLNGAIAGKDMRAELVLPTHSAQQGTALLTRDQLFESLKQYHLRHQEEPDLIFFPKSQLRTFENTAMWGVIQRKIQDFNLGEEFNLGGCRAIVYPGPEVWVTKHDYEED